MALPLSYKRLSIDEQVLLVTHLKYPAWLSVMLQETESQFQLIVISDRNGVNSLLL